MMKTTDELVREAIVEEDARRATRKKHKLLQEENNEKNDHAPGQLDPRSHNKAKGKQAQVRFRDEHRDSLDDGDDGIALERQAQDAKKRRIAARRGGNLVRSAEDLGLGDLSEAEERGHHHHNNNSTASTSSANPAAPQAAAAEGAAGGGGSGDPPMTAFNLDDERATGRFDEDGNCYWNDEKDKDGTRREKGDDAEDAWLKGAEVLEGEKHEAAMRARRERERRRDDEPEELTERQIASLNMRVSDLLLPGETLRRGLARLGGQRSKAKTGSGRRRGLPPGLSTAGAADDDAPAANEEGFKELTDCSAALVGAGEFEAYSKTKEEFDRAAQLFLGGAEDDDDDDDGGGGDDMFASDLDDDEGKKGEDVSAWPVSRLKSYLAERGADLEGVLEKGELVRLAQERFALERKVPAGYAFDAQSGYYYSHQDQLYLDPGSGYHYDGKEWFKKK
ncbi:OCRE domain-containing protein [Chloropicon roscoffensis]|uniref:OCRE domain-containing protein n=1 Tax=Chloropicon roscoffensis TaxID=1461544 RepID=A0AAX4PEX6_9CHLO